VDNVFSGKFPKTVPLLLHAHHKEVNRDDWTSGDFEVFLHQADDYLSLFCNSQSELGVIEPAIICV
jgi:hypothetical protein